VISVSWGICFSLKANPNALRRSDSGTVLAQGTRLLFAAPGKANRAARYSEARTLEEYAGCLLNLFSIDLAFLVPPGYCENFNGKLRMNG
jgi:hypothetical protein